MDTPPTRLTVPRSPAASLAGRVAVVGIAVAVAAVNAGGAGWPMTVTAVVCGVAILLPRLPIALQGPLLQTLVPLVVAVGAAAWGWPFTWLLSIAAYDLAFHRRARTALGFIALAWAGNTLGWPATSIWRDQWWVNAIVVPVMAVLAGLWLGSRRRLVQALADQVESLGVQTQLREDAARAAERARIAAEMHDVLAHRLSLLALHTGVLLTRGDVLPPGVLERLRLLRETSVEALSDLRDVLGALHHDGSAGAGLAPPVPGLDDLIAESRSAGQDVTVTVTGDETSAPTAHRLAVHRITREALTNARKHAPGAPVCVLVTHTTGDTHLAVTNAESVSRDLALPPARSGFGLVGVGERTAALGGTLHAGPTADGGWALDVSLPHRNAGTAGNVETGTVQR